MSVTSRMARAFRAPERGPFLLVVKAAAAAILAWLLASALIQGPPPVFGAIAALLVVQPSVDQSFAKAIERSIGVIAGVVVASLLGLAFGSQTWVVLVAIAAGLLLGWVLRLTPGGASQVAISALLVLTLGTATPGYSVDRILETLLGAAIGFAVNVAIVPPVAVAPAHARIDAVGEEIAASLDRLADALVTPYTPAQREELILKARLLHPMLASAEASIRAGEDSLTLNPRGRRNRAELADLKSLLETFTPMVRQVGGMTRAVYDHYDETLGDEPLVRDIADQLRRAAHDVRLTVRRVSATDEAPVEQEPALTAPLRVVAPPAHWVLVGALMEDLRRVHEGLVASGR